MSVVRRGLPLRQRALACPINFKTVDDAPHNCCFQTRQFYGWAAAFGICRLRCPPDTSESGIAVYSTAACDPFTGSAKN
jgi:hypothetical protein